MIFKDLRLLVLMMLVAISLYLIIAPLVFGKTGVIVSKLDKNSKCTNVNTNSVITQAAAYQIKTSGDFYKALVSVNKDDLVLIIADGLPANCVAINDRDIGIDVSGIKKGNLVFGIDIEGGSRVLLKPKGNLTKEILDETIATLNTRINLYGLRDIRISPIGNNLLQVELGGTTSADINDFLSRQGRFEGKLEQNVKLTDGVGKFQFLDEMIKLKLLNNTVMLSNLSYPINETFELDDIKVTVGNASSDSVSVFSTIFTGKDIVAVFTDPENSFVRSSGNGFQFVFTVQVSQESAERFAKLTKSQPVKFGGSENYLDPELVLFLDDEPVTKLNIVASLAGQTLTKPSIQGFRESRTAAINERLQLQSILRSGSLPVGLEIIKTDIVTQTAGKALIDSTIYVALAAALIVSVIIFFRYRDLKIAVPMVLISFSEIILILGFAALTQVATKGVGWVIDIPAIAGVIAIIGTGVNQLIIITDQILQEPDTSLKHRHKTAMSIIFSSAYIVIAAMLPLMIAGVGTLKGFAITTIIGVLIAIFITRPAYMAILEKVKHLS